MSGSDQMAITRSTRELKATDLDHFLNGRCPGYLEESVDVNKIKRERKLLFACFIRVNLKTIMTFSYRYLKVKLSLEREKKIQ